MLAGYAARLRFVLEAQSMAQLAHPNIVSVFDVGEHAGQIFIAMELVAGTTLRDWMAEPHRWREIRDMFVACGRGLEAAHKAGVVHRDFKPENVLIGTDGRICVTDFGLARTQRLGSSDQESGIKRGSKLFGGDTPVDLTTTGEIMGTPAYMSPEQHAGDDTDARTDQFSFCVALYEALYGARPFQGRTFAELGIAVAGGLVHTPEAAPRVPRWLRNILLRGVRADREQRFETMTELLENLQRDPGRKAVRIALVGALVAGTATASVFAASRTEDPCADSDAPMVTAWNPKKAASIATAFAATGVPFAADTAQRVRGQLDTYTQEWRGQRLAACKDTHARRQTQDLFDRRSLCLDNRLAALEALVDRFEHATPSAIESAVRTTSELPDLAGCNDREALLARVPPPPPAQRGTIRVIERSLAAIPLRDATGGIASQIADTERLVTEARTLGYAPLTGEAEQALGELLQDKGDMPAARGMFETALASASRGRDDELIAEVWVHRMQLETDLDPKSPIVDTLELAARSATLRVGQPLLDGTLHAALGARRLMAGRLDDAQHELEAARDAYAVASSTSSTELRTARALHNLALVQQRKGDFTGAKATLLRSLDIQREIVGPDNPQLQKTEAVLSSVLRALGDNAGAIELAKRTLAVRERLYGPNHGEVAASAIMLGNVYYSTRDAAAALAQYERALSIDTAFHGPEDAETGKAHGNVGLALMDLGKNREARSHLESALQIAERTGDAEQIGRTLDDLSMVTEALGDLPASIQLSRRSLDVLVQQHGKDHPTVATAQINLALSLHSAKQYDEASGLLTKAIAVWDKAYGAENPRMVQPLVALGQVEVDRNNPRAALGPLERAVAFTDQPPATRGIATFMLARALRATHGKKERVLALAREARAIFENPKTLRPGSDPTEVRELRAAIARFLRGR